MTYVVDPEEDDPAVGVVADSAYWLSGLTVRDGGTNGTVDARSLASGRGTPTVLPVESGGGALVGGHLPALPWVSRTQSWSAAPPGAARDALELTATNLRTVTVDVRRAGLSCAADLDVTTDGPLDVVLAGCGRTLRFGA